MKSNYLLRFSFLLGLCILAKSFVINAQTEKWQTKVGAKTFPAVTKLFVVKHTKSTDYTATIQGVIDECSAKGGGIVAFQSGNYLIGSVFLKNNVHLRIDKGVTLLGIQKESAYKLIKTRVAGVELTWPAAMLNVIGQKNVAISGKGIINGQGKYFWDKFWALVPDYQKKGLRWAVDYDCQRPRGILVQESSQVTLKDFTIQEPGFWTVHLLYSKNVTVDGIVIQNNIHGHGPSSDGLDIDSSSEILIQNCDIDCNDDNFCLKAGKDADGLRVNRVCENILIRNCVSRAGHGLLTFGSETSGGIRNIEAYNLKAQGTLYGIRLKSAKTRGGIIENAYIHDIEMNDVFVPIYGSLNWYPLYSYSILPEGLKEIPEHWKILSEKVPEEKGIPTFRNFVIENLHAVKSGSAIELEGLENSYLDNFVLRNCKIDCKRPGFVKYASNWLFDKIEINALSNEDITEDKCKNNRWVYKDK